MCLLAKKTGPLLVVSKTKHSKTIIALRDVRFSAQFSKAHARCTCQYVPKIFTIVRTLSTNSLVDTSCRVMMGNILFVGHVG